MTAGILITGTDTGVGKTLVATSLLIAAARTGLRTTAMKPVAAGIDQEGRQEDVDALLASATVQADRKVVNPFCFAPPIAPHLAAAEAGVSIDIEKITKCFEQLLSMSDLVVVEGAGGFLVPLSEETDFGDLAFRLGLPVVLVVGIRLGCLNHALLTAEAIRRRGLVLAGWVANRIDPATTRADENIATLRARLPAPLLAELPYSASAEQAASCFSDWFRSQSFAR